MTRSTYYKKRFQGPARSEAFLDIAHHLHDEIIGRCLSDPEETIASLLEEAFQAGRESAKSHTENASTAKRAMPIVSSRQQAVRPARRMTEDDLPAMPHRSLNLFTMALGLKRNEQVFHPPTAEGLVLIMQPRVPGYSPSMTRDKWFNYCLGGTEGLGNTTVLPLVKLGLFEEPIMLRDGWKVTYMTEWGFELFLTGDTDLPEDRVPGGSSTYERFAELHCDRKELFFSVARTTGLMRERTVATDINDESIPGRRF